ncbi:flagellar biosynthesis protein FliQ [Sinanaerobacter sp. ZZT-01]|uniref:flagellar biosynthesis protein FliQ n=1 Tax=Sinanaerobacter sp. ZZT-01 TaxID=3111540 RepID=UPI002D78153A|nr:flagellar biosynthesis protein FliQ [Sinanaerobacter sp. ZZT-01]WRR93594.1 flagellar biosynthesis protein FliQ [Sinanaerobacter sp. ZZT-01]
MTVSSALEVMQDAIVLATKLAAPMLLISMLIGLIISIFQAATQIHEQTITFVPKLLLIAIILLAGGSWMLESLMNFTEQIFYLMQK